MKVLAVIPSAGSGRRMRSKIDKPFIRLCKKHMIWHTLKAMQASGLVSEIVVAASPRNIVRIKRLISRNGFSKVKEVVSGGKTRSASVFNALKKIRDDVDIVLIHDVARPLITQDIIRRSVEAAIRYGASVAAVPVKPTIKKAVKGYANRTLNRGSLWEAQTPQAFKKELLLAAYKRFRKKLNRFTDDSSLVEALGHRVRIVMGRYDNIKITTPEDLITAEGLLKRA